MSTNFVEREIRLDILDAIYIGYDWRIQPIALVNYIEARRLVTPLRLVKLD